ncbi:hypothetical protein H0H81_002301 [Sphagnurus paluster]|uniref:Uncharacterized protein n=1 Tax=Sphagnurus paluster TaxID=117069 RepID=A0A9P7G222_9AGAR|nr:hypothetical protein H0H81_002301 [Sphagnurus paluster]
MTTDDELPRKRKTSKGKLSSKKPSKRKKAHPNDGQGERATDTDYTATPIPTRQTSRPDTNELSTATRARRPSQRNASPGPLTQEVHRTRSKSGVESQKKRKRVGAAPKEVIELFDSDDEEPSRERKRRKHNAPVTPHPKKKPPSGVEVIDLCSDDDDEDGDKVASTKSTPKSTNSAPKTTTPMAQSNEANPKSTPARPVRRSSAVSSNPRQSISMSTSTQKSKKPKPKELKSKESKSDLRRKSKFGDDTQLSQSAEELPAIEIIRKRPIRSVLPRPIAVPVAADLVDPAPKSTLQPTGTSTNPTNAGSSSPKPVFTLPDSNHGQQGAVMQSAISEPLEASGSSAAVLTEESDYIAKPGEDEEDIQTGIYSSLIDRGAFEKAISVDDKQGVLEGVRDDHVGVTKPNEESVEASGSRLNTPIVHPKGPSIPSTSEALSPRPTLNTHSSISDPTEDIPKHPTTPESYPPLPESDEEEERELQDALALSISLDPPHSQALPKSEDIPVAPPDELGDFEQEQEDIDQAIFLSMIDASKDIEPPPSTENSPPGNVPEESEPQVKEERLEESHIPEHSQAEPFNCAPSADTAAPPNLTASPTTLPLPTSPEPPPLQEEPDAYLQELEERDMEEAVLQSVLDISVMDLIPAAESPRALSLKEDVVDTNMEATKASPKGDLNTNNIVTSSPTPVPVVTQDDLLYNRTKEPLSKEEELHGSPVPDQSPVQPSASTPPTVIMAPRRVSASPTSVSLPTSPEPPPVQEVPDTYLQELEERDMEEVVLQSVLDISAMDLVLPVESPRALSPKDDVVDTNMESTKASPKDDLDAGDIAISAPASVPAATLPVATQDGLLHRRTKESPSKEEQLHASPVPGQSPVQPSASTSPTVIMAACQVSASLTSVSLPTSPEPPPLQEEPDTYLQELEERDMEEAVLLSVLDASAINMVPTTESPQNSQPKEDTGDANMEEIKALTDTASVPASTPLPSPAAKDPPLPKKNKSSLLASISERISREAPTPRPLPIRASTICAFSSPSPMAPKLRPSFSGPCIPGQLTQRFFAQSFLLPKHQPGALQVAPVANSIAVEEARQSTQDPVDVQPSPPEETNKAGTPEAITEDVPESVVAENSSISLSPAPFDPTDDERAADDVVARPMTAEDLENDPILTQALNESRLIMGILRSTERAKSRILKQTPIPIYANAESTSQSCCQSPPQDHLMAESSDPAPTNTSAPQETPMTFALDDTKQRSPTPELASPPQSMLLDGPSTPEPVVTSPPPPPESVPAPEIITDSASQKSEPPSTLPPSAEMPTSDSPSLLLQREVSTEQYSQSSHSEGETTSSASSSLATLDDSPPPSTPTLVSPLFDTSSFFVPADDLDDILPEVDGKIMDIPALPFPETDDDDDDDDLLLSQCFMYPEP